MNFQYVANYTAEVLERIFTALCSKSQLLKRFPLAVVSQLENILVDVFQNLRHDLDFQIFTL